MAEELDPVVVEIMRSIKVDLAFPTTTQIEFGYVKIVDGYAMSLWESEHIAGIAFSRETDTGWQSIGGGGGVPDLEYMISIGIPRSVAQQFADYLNRPRD
ncbi:MAG: hypothetical protein ACFBSE_14705 [Prochloraceae cyanobacterium]